VRRYRRPYPRGPCHALVASPLEFPRAGAGLSAPPVERTESIRIDGAARGERNQWYVSGVLHCGWSGTLRAAH
jgi:hypothetical protein